MNPLSSLVRWDPGKDHGQLNIPGGGQSRHQVEKLKHKSDLMAAQPGQFVLRQTAGFLSRKPVGSTGRPIQASQDMQ
jgi:hypothetical protein